MIVRSPAQAVVRPVFSRPKEAPIIHAAPTPPSLGPSLALNFITQAYAMNGAAKAFGDLITVARDSEGGRYNASGVYEMVGVGQPRFDHDPITNAAKGLLIEESRTNLITHSSDYSTWANNGGGATPLVITPAAAEGPRGPNTMTKVARGGLGIRYLHRDISAPIGSTVTVTQVAKAGALGTVLSMRLSSTLYANRADAAFNLANGTSGAVPSGDITNVTASMVSLGNGEWRCTLTAKSGAVAWGQLQIAPNNIMDGVDYPPSALTDVYLDMTQLEQGAYATSYIPTDASQVTRAADVVSVNTLSPWYNADAGTLYVDALAVTNLDCGYAQLWTGVVDNRIGIIRTTTTRGVIRTGAVDQASLTVASTPGVKAAIAYGANDAAFSVNGAAVLTDNTVSLPTVTQLAIGRTDGAFLHGHIHNLTYHPRRLINADLQALTA